GLYARTLAANAEALGEDMGQYNALREALLDDYAPEGLYEESLVERIALLTWRRNRLLTQAHRNLGEGLAEGYTPRGCVLSSEDIIAAETKLDRAISRMHRDLVFLHRYRGKALQEDLRRTAREPVRPAPPSADAVETEETPHLEPGAMQASENSTGPEQP